MAAREDDDDAKRGELKTSPSSKSFDRPRGTPPSPSDMMLRGHPASSCCGRMGGRVLARPVTTNSRFDSPPDEVPLTIAYGDERERGTGTAARRAQRYPRLFWQHENPTGPCYGPTQRAPATARVHTNYQVTHMTSTASCHTTR